MTDERYAVDRIWVQTPAGPEPITVGGPLLALPLSGARSGVVRDDATIEKTMETPIRANSVEEVCQAFDVRIEGQFEDVDGQAKSVSLRAQNERSFTVDEMTRRHPVLRQRYIEMRMCEALAKLLAGKSDATLKEQEIAVLREKLEFLERTLPPEEDAR